jgi:hypothetical protein
MSKETKENKKYRKMWADAFGPIPKDFQGRSYEIHHINGNHSDNRLDNFKLVTIDEHYAIHYAQGDFGACKMISLRMRLSPSEISQIQSDLSKRMWECDIHRENVSRKLREYANTPEGLSARSRAGKKGYANQSKEAKLARASKGGTKSVENGALKAAQLKSVRKVMSLDDGKITCGTWTGRYETLTGYKHTWIDL